MQKWQAKAHTHTPTPLHSIHHFAASHFAGLPEEPDVRLPALPPAASLLAAVDGGQGHHHHPQAAGGHHQEGHDEQEVLPWGRRRRTRRGPGNSELQGALIDTSEKKKKVTVVFFFACDVRRNSRFVSPQREGFLKSGFFFSSSSSSSSSSFQNGVIWKKRKKKKATTCARCFSSLVCVCVCVGAGRVGREVSPLQFSRHLAGGFCTKGNSSLSSLQWVDFFFWVLGEGLTRRGRREKKALHFPSPPPLSKTVLEDKL